MKHRIVLAILLGVFLSITVNAQKSYSPYRVENGTAYYQGEPMVSADISTFRILGAGYAKDRNNVYMNGKILPYVDPSSFRVIIPKNDQEGIYNYDFRGHRDGGYFKSTFDVFYDGQKIEGASASSFQVLKNGYAKDSFNVFYRGKKIDGCSASSFAIIDGGYVKDSFNVYYYGTKVPDASASSFVYDGKGYAHDAFSTFFHGKKISN